MTSCAISPTSTERAAAQQSKNSKKGDFGRYNGESLVATIHSNHKAEDHLSKLKSYQQNG